MSNEITVFTSTTCPHCVTVKEYLSEKGVNFVEKNVQQDPAARKELMQKGIMAVPVVKVNEEMIVGFDKERLEDLLGL